MHFQYAVCRTRSQMQCRLRPGCHSACRAVTPRIVPLSGVPCHDGAVYAWSNTSSSRRTRSSNSASSQERVFLLALAQQQIAAADPVVRRDLARDVVDALLIDVDPALLDTAPRFALGLGEPGLGHEIDDRHVAVSLDGDRRDLAGEDVEYLRVHLRLLFTE